MTNTFNPRILNVRLSPIVAISEEVRKRSPQFTQKTGKSFILFQRGEIDYPTPQFIVDAAKRALDAGYTKYPKSGGEEVLKDAILKKLRDYNRVDGLTRDNIVCTYGGQEALQLAFTLFAGKRGAGFAPCWSCVLENFVPYAGVDFTEVPLEHDFSINTELLEAVLKDVSFFYLNSPHNPTGKVFSEEEVRTVVDLCTRHNVYVISDEAYERIVYEGRKFFSPTSLLQNNILGTFTFSKSYSMTGWRLGYLVASDKQIAKLIRLGDYTQTAGVVTFLQHAGREALENIDAADKALSEMRLDYERRRDALLAGLSSIPGIEVTKPQGGFYMFPDFSQLIPDDLDKQGRSKYIYEKLMNVGVATVYGSCFGNHFTDNIRFSFSTTPLPAIEEGLSRIRDACV
jgi:aspartate aminotransferase